MVKRDHDQMADRRRGQRDVDGREIAFVEAAVTAQPRTIVRRGRVHAHDIEARERAHLHARSRHQRAGDVVAEAIVVAGNDHQPAALNERREDAVERLELTPEPAVGDVARCDDDVHVRIDQRLAQTRRIGVGLRAAADMKVRNVRESRRRGPACLVHAQAS